MPQAETDWSKHWPLDPQVHHLNHGSFGGCPQAVLDFQAELRQQMERQPVSFLNRELPERLDEARNALAGFLDCDPEDLAFVRNATQGVNSVLRSLALSPEDELLVTNHAYPACRNALDFVSERAGVQVVVVDIPFPIDAPEQVTEAILSAVSLNTRLLLLDHVTSPTALVFPLEELLRELEGIEVLVDGAHAPGMLDISLRELAPAYYAGNCHKWMCSPKGAGFLYVRRDLQEMVRPTSISHGATVHGERGRFLSEFDWTGTDDPTAILSVPEAIRFIGSLLSGGWPELQRRNHALALEAQGTICEALSLARPCPEEMVGSMSSFPLPRDSANSMLEEDSLTLTLYSNHRIEVPVEYWPKAPQRALRVSAQLYNRPEQYKLLGEALRQSL